MTAIKTVWALRDKRGKLMLDAYRGIPQAFKLKTHAQEIAVFYPGTKVVKVFVSVREIG